MSTQRPETSLPRSGEGWLRAHRHDAYGVIKTDTPATARELTAGTTATPRQVGHLVEMGILKIHQREYQRRRAADNDRDSPRGHTYTITPGARKYLRDNIDDPRDNPGWCEDPDCARETIQHEDIPRCKCGAPIRGDIE